MCGEEKRENKKLTEPLFYRSSRIRLRQFDVKGYQEACMSPQGSSKLT